MEAVVITFKMNGRENEIVARTPKERRFALLDVMGQVQFTVPEATLDSVRASPEDKDAWALPQDVVDMMGPALRFQIMNQREKVEKQLVELRVNAAAVALQERLLMMSRADAEQVTVLVNGQEVNAVDHIAYTLNVIFVKQTWRRVGLTRELFTEELLSSVTF